MDEPRLHPLVEMLKGLVDHLLGRKDRLNFRRIFLATSQGRRCQELDRLEVTPAPCRNEYSGRETGYWMPAWTWPYVQRAFRDIHNEKVRRGETSPVPAAFQPVVNHVEQGDRMQARFTIVDDE
jgi:hypothetical protein